MPGGQSYAKDRASIALPEPENGLTFYQLNAGCGDTVVDDETVVGLEFEPRCLVVVVAASSRRELFEQLSTEMKMNLS